MTSLRRIGASALLCVSCCDGYYLTTWVHLEIVDSGGGWL